MTNWIATDDVQFPIRGAVFLIGARGVLTHSMVSEIINHGNKDPDTLAEVLRRILVLSEPELEGAQIISFGFDSTRYSWTLVVMHESLPATGFGIQFESRHLLVDWNAVVGDERVQEAAARSRDGRV